MAHRIVLIAGDGIGPEVAAATRLVLDAADVGIEWVPMPAGASALESHGALPVPEPPVGVLVTFVLDLLDAVCVRAGFGSTVKVAV